jgi:hypothetical protein
MLEGAPSLWERFVRRALKAGAKPEAAEEILERVAWLPLARIYGVRLGRRLLVPAHVVEMVLRGEFDQERVNLEARKRRKWEGGGR